MLILLWLISLFPSRFQENDHVFFYNGKYNKCSGIVEKVYRTTANDYYIINLNYCPAKNPYTGLIKVTEEYLDYDE